MLLPFWLEILIIIGVPVISENGDLNFVSRLRISSTNNCLFPMVIGSLRSFFLNSIELTCLIRCLLGEDIIMYRVSLVLSLDLPSEKMFEKQKNLYPFLL